MSKEKYENLSIQELNQKRSYLKTTASLLASALIVLFIVTIWNTIQKGASDWFVLVSFSSIVFHNFREANKIATIIKSREKIQ